MAAAVQTLSHRVLPPRSTARPTRWCYLLHGLLGNARNLQGFTSSLAAQAGDNWGFVAVDVRGHGGSKGFTRDGSPPTLLAAAYDVHALAEATGRWPDVLVGHSLGGKVLLRGMADRGLSTSFVSQRQSAADSPLQVFMLDIQPGLGEPAQVAALDAIEGRLAGSHNSSGTSHLPPISTDSVLGILELVSSVSSVPSRAWLVEEATKRGAARSTAAWLASSLARASSAPDAPFQWTFDAAVARALFRDYLSFDGWPELLGQRSSSGAAAAAAAVTEGIEMELVVATRSSRWLEPQAAAALAALEEAGSASRTRVSRVEGGHWVHADNPAGVIARVAPHLK